MSAEKRFCLYFKKPFDKFRAIPDFVEESGGEMKKEKVLPGLYSLLEEIIKRKKEWVFNRDCLIFRIISHERIPNFVIDVEKLNSEMFPHYETYRFNADGTCECEIRTTINLHSERNGAP